MMSSILKAILGAFSLLIKLLPPSSRSKIIMAMIEPSVNYSSPKDAFNFLFKLDSDLYKLHGQTAIRYGGGTHTKHRHTNYHRFFVENIKQGEKVMDIGSGNGFLAYDMARQVEGVEVTGIELSASKVKYAIQHYQNKNLNFIHGDALKDLPGQTFNVVTLSNVLEHIEYRVEFLKELIKKNKPERFLLRVPMFERDWRVPLKAELGMDYRLDGTHFIEYRQEEFFAELEDAGLKPVHSEFRWGEIWCIAEPK